MPTCSGMEQSIEPGTPQHRSSECQDEKGVLPAIFDACEEGDLDIIKQLLSSAQIDVNLRNMHGETALHVACGAGRLDVVRLLVTLGADVHAKDQRDEGAIYFAARHGHSEVLRLLIEQGADVNSRSKSGRTPLHIACRYGHLHSVRLLCQSHSHPDIRDSEGETGMHCAAGQGRVEVVQCLLESGADPGCVDRRGSTPLHLSLHRHHTSTAQLLLLQAGTHPHHLDQNGEAPIHIACREGLVLPVQTLCSLKCAMDLANDDGLYPLHLAAKHGHTDVIRELCLAGCIVDQPNRRGIRAEITAIKHGHNETSNLLGQLGQPGAQEHLVSRLSANVEGPDRVKVLLFGHSGVGKTTLVESMKTGYFSCFFRRSRSIGSAVGARETAPLSIGGKPHLEMKPTRPRGKSMSFDTGYENYTRGIDINQTCLPGVGDVSLWDFSGLDSYYVFYHRFIDSSCRLFLLLFRLCDPSEVQKHQLMFWLSFLQARIPPERLMLGGSDDRVKLALVATHVDSSVCVRRSHGDHVDEHMAELLRLARDDLGRQFDVHDSVFMVDATAAGSPSVKLLKSYLAEMKVELVKHLPETMGLLEDVVEQLEVWRESQPLFPVLTWTELLARVRLEVNPLVRNEHVQQVLRHLQDIGEVVCIESSGGEEQLVILSPRWICSDILGYMLSKEFLHRCKSTGCYTVEEFQMIMPEYVAPDLLEILESFQLCTQCENDGEVEYEFPCYNFVETLEGLWDPPCSPPVPQLCYGGVRLRSPVGTQCLLGSMFTRIQVQLRRFLHGHANKDADLYQWSEGSKFCVECVESLLTLLPGGSEIELKVRGPVAERLSCFRVMQELLSVMDKVLLEMSPGLAMEHHYISPVSLQSHSRAPELHSPCSLSSAAISRHRRLADPPGPAESTSCAVQPSSSSDQQRLMSDGCSCPVVSCPAAECRLLRDAVCFGCDAALAALVWWPRLPVAALRSAVRGRLCAALDPAHPLGADWCLLTVQLGLTERLQQLEETPSGSRTGRLLDECHQLGVTIGKLHGALLQLGRRDVADELAAGAPLHCCRSNHSTEVPLHSRFSDQSTDVPLHSRFSDQSTDVPLHSRFSDQSTDVPLHSRFSDQSTDVPLHSRFSDQSTDVPLHSRFSDQSTDVPLHSRCSDHSTDVPLHSRFSDQSTDVPLHSRFSDQFTDVPLHSRCSDHSTDVPLHCCRSNHSTEVPLQSFRLDQSTDVPFHSRCSDQSTDVLFHSRCSDQSTDAPFHSRCSDQSTDVPFHSRCSDQSTDVLFHYRCSDQSTDVPFHSRCTDQSTDVPFHSRCSDQSGSSVAESFKSSSRVSR